MACFVYEGVLLFGVVMAAGLVYGVATGQRHALAGTFGLRVVLFLVLGAYFVGFWTRQGETLAMRTWRVRLVTRNGGSPPGVWRAAARYLLAWMWFVPALMVLHVGGLTGGGQAFAVLLAGVGGYAALTRLHVDRQFWHDVVCGTRLVHATQDDRGRRGQHRATPGER